MKRIETMMNKKKIFFQKTANQKGMTLPELMIATLILLPLFAGVMLTFVKCMEYADMATHSSLAVWASKNRIAEIENTLFDDVYNSFHNVTFTTPGVDGVGITYVDNTNPNLLAVTVSFSWQERSGRVIGEDKNLDGQINVGEDANANGMLDSIVGFATLVHNS